MPETTPAVPIAITPPGFTPAQWDQFAEDGFLVIEDALDEAQLARLKAAVEEAPEPTAWNVVETDPRFEEMIDHPAHVGYVYDVYGEMLKLLRSEYFRRPPGQTIRNKWHFDGPRSLPFQVFAERAPLRIKVGYWLTDLPHGEMGNLTYIPGSHHQPYLSTYHMHEAHPNEVAVTVRAGAMTLMWGGLWHRVAENSSDVTRLNMFLEYGPTWITTSDRVHSDAGWLSKLGRTRRILMRDYVHPNHLIKLPAEDVPLFNRRPGEPDPEAGVYGPHVPLELRKRTTWLERHLAS
ncbi:phytanoyl-CoA dioxygenase family protein [Micromonospora sp. NPDC000089]|uniref:phytanoyl-CoA dioxygenase family protein n=1 Tax=unclassified Micromonospora TaxID=2617518 RepID=UPI0036808AA6